MFPLQVVIGLDQPGLDHTGGELLMVEQQPRAQPRGWSTAAMRHGVSTLRSGTRRTLGLIFHDAC